MPVFCGKRFGDPQKRLFFKTFPNSGLCVKDCDVSIRKVFRRRIHAPPHDAKEVKTAQWKKSQPFPEWQSGKAQQGC